MPGWVRGADVVVPAPRRCVFVDVETTGLDVDRHQVTEVGWQDLSTGQSGCFVPPHTVCGADPDALTISRYAERIAGRPVDDGRETARLHRLLGGDGQVTTFVAVNPSFDTAMVERMFTRAGITPTAPWHHRKIDVSMLAYSLFPDRFPPGEVPGLAAVAAALGVPADGHHGAAADVRIGVACYRRLETLRVAVRRGHPDGLGG